MASTPGFEPGPHWWEASTLTSVPSPASQKTDLEKRVSAEKGKLTRPKRKRYTKLPDKARAEKAEKITVNSGKNLVF